MSNKTNIEEGIKILKNITKQDFSNPVGWSGYYDSELKELQKAIENVLAYIERLEREKEIHIKLEQQYKKEYLDEKAKYDSLVEKIRNNLRKKEIIKECETISDREHLDGEIFALQELLDTERK